ncbi:MAG: hypothetical protein U1F48_05640 [Burkholderiales bacterium]
MTQGDWFRRSTWSEIDRAAFFARLSRSRSEFHKAQYVRIQAFHLAEADTPEMHSAALELLGLLFRDWPENSQLAQAYDQRARSLLALGNVDGAIESFRMALDAQRNEPSIRTDAHLGLAWLVATSAIATEYTEALEALDEFETGPFPTQQYSAAAARALILDATGKGVLLRSGRRGLSQQRDSQVHLFVITVL